MITELNIKNFKSIKEKSIKLSRLNVLTGLNGMGKSSFIQVILSLNASRRLSEGELSLANQFVDIGKGRDALYQFASEETINIGVKFVDDVSLNWHFDYDSESQVLHSNFRISSTELAKYSLFNDNLKYLNAERISPRSIYKTSFGVVNNLKQLGNSGEYATHFLHTFGNKKLTPNLLLHPKAKSEILIHQVEAWLSEISPGVKLNTTEIPGTENILLDYQFETKDGFTSRFKPQNVGFGLSYTLPVITMLLSSKAEDILIIENPESHVHPRGQAELGKLLALCSANGSQLIIETHSDHIVNGIRVSVKENKVNHREVNVLFFNRTDYDSEQYSEITNIQVDREGNLSNYPENFLDEWNNQLLKLI